MSSSSTASRTSGRLEGKVALITGGASGIGESIARLFIKEGSKICIIDTQDSSIGETLCADLGGDAHAHYIHGDVTIERDVQQAVDLTVAKFGGLDVMVNNAGLSGPKIADIREYSMTDFNRVFDVNVNGVFLGMKHASRIMIPRRKGSIISIASVTSKVGGCGPHGYTGSKHAVVGLTKSVAAEMGKHGVRVNCVSPYAIPTSLSFDHLPEEEKTAEVLEDHKAAFVRFVESCANLKGVSLSPDDVAQAVLFLAGDESKDLNPLHNVVEERDYKDRYYNHLLPLSNKYSKLLPWGEEITSESMQFFSPIVIWSKYASNDSQHEVLFSAFVDYFEAWLQLMDEASEEKDPAKILHNRNAQHRYLSWRAQKDPGLQVLKNLVGEDTAEDVVRNFLFYGVDCMRRGRTFLDYFPEYQLEDGSVSKKRSIAGKSFETRPWDQNGNFIAQFTN